MKDVNIKALTRIKENYERLWRENLAKEEDVKEEYDAVCAGIKAIEQTRWIPVSERLPEKSGCYLAYIINEHDNKLQYAMTAYFFSDSIFSNPWEVDDECASDNVVAWMSLPKPYRVESEDKE